MKKIYILSLALIVLLAGAAVYYFYFLPSEEANSNTDQENLNENVNSGLNANADPVNGNLNQNTNLSVKTDEETIKEICFTFAERYGSYSNSNNFQSFIDLKSGMTASLQKETDGLVALKQKEAANASYFAVFTKVIAQNITGLTSQKADCQVTAQRTERNETAETASYFQNLLLQFNKEGETWLVNQAAWQDKINTQ